MKRIDAIRSELLTVWLQTGRKQFVLQISTWDIGCSVNILLMYEYYTTEIKVIHLAVHVLQSHVRTRL
jgi:hypothetical protein